MIRRASLLHPRSDAVSPSVSLPVLLILPRIAAPHLLPFSDRAATTLIQTAYEPLDVAGFPLIKQEFLRNARLFSFQFFSEIYSQFDVKHVEILM